MEQTTEAEQTKDERPKDLIDSTQAARELGISRNHLRRWILAGKLTAWRTGKRYFVSQADVKKKWQRVVPGGGE